MTNSEWDKIKYFKSAEFNQPDKMSFELIKILDRIREFTNQPITITSSYREGDDKSHGRGLAVDFRCNDSVSRHNFIKAIIGCKISRFGIYDKHIHVDIDNSLPQRVVWVGKSE